LVIATPQSEDELARLQRHNKRLEELIEIYEKQFSVDALAALAYPSLAFAHVPLPHAKVLFFCLSLSLSILYCHIRISVLLGFTWCRLIPSPQAGWLLRLVGRVKKTWRRRLFLLKDDFLLCYASTESACPDHIFRHAPHFIRVWPLMCMWQLDERLADKRKRSHRLHRGAPIRSVELYLTAFKEVKKDRDDAAGTADPRPRDQSSCYPYCLEIGITHDPRNGYPAAASPAGFPACPHLTCVVCGVAVRTRGPTGKCLMVSADSEESQRDWFYCLKRAATAKWYRDTTREAPEASLSDEVRALTTAASSTSTWAPLTWSYRQRMALEGRLQWPCPPELCICRRPLVQQRTKSTHPPAPAMHACISRAHHQRENE
jgi:hypothetical protein